MKTTLNAELFRSRFGSTEKRQYKFSSLTIAGPLKVLSDLLSAFSANRGHRKITVQLTIEKGK